VQTIDNFLIEITLKKKKFDKVPQEFLAIANRYKQFESDERLVLDISRHWEGFKDGTIINMLKHFGEAIYVALAYVSDNDDIVVGFDGLPVDSFTIAIDGVQKKKYIKKKLRIVKIMDRAKEIFQVQDYVLNLDYLDSIIKVFDAYCVGSASNFKLKDFVDEASIN